MHEAVRQTQEVPQVHGKAYARVDLNNMDGLEHLAWAVYDGVFFPRDPPTLTGYHDWQWIIVGPTLHLIYQGATAGANCPLCSGVTPCGAGH